MHRPDPKKVAPIVLTVLILGGGLWWWFSRQAQNGVIKASGTIEAVEVVIAPEIAGRVTAINVSEGQAVTAGQVLATLDYSLLKAQRAQAAASLALPASADSPAESSTESPALVAVLPAPSASHPASKTHSG